MKIYRPVIYFIAALSVAVLFNSCGTNKIKGNEMFFPAPGQGLDKQKMKSPQEMGINPDVIDQIKQYTIDNPWTTGPRAKEVRWALWRNGFLVHLEGDFGKIINVASLRKTWLAMAVGAAIKQGKIPSIDQKISIWLPELKGIHAEATWRHVMSQSAGFDYPFENFPAFKPGEMWTYSDWNPMYLSLALARVYGKKDYHDNFDDVIKAAYFDAIGMQGWKTDYMFDNSSKMEDGIRFYFSLEHMGRLGLLALARGTWNGKEIVPRWFVEQMETKQTTGMKVNYNGPYDGATMIDQYGKLFRESPYGLMTWLNADGNYYPGADKAWAWGAGNGGTIILWDRNNGIVFAGVGICTSPDSHGIPQIIEAGLTREIKQKN